MATKLADAYVQIIPSAKGIQGSITEAICGEAQSAGASAGSGIASKLKGAIAAAGIGAAVVKAVKGAIDEGSELQQNIGGTQAVFGEFAKTVQDDAYEAYKNMGLSASDYMATANKMGSLFQGSGLEQQRAMDLTSKAMQRAADVASVMGIDASVAMESIAGAAKGNFTMMDNLGVAMNATTLEAYALEKGVNFKWNTASNAEKAELAMEMFFDRTSQYAGNFAREADTTFSGSFQAMATSAKNVLGNMALGQDVKAPLSNLLTSTKTFLTGNLLPMIGNVIKSVPGIFSSVFEFAANAITSVNWIEAGKSLIGKIKEGINNLSTDIPTAIQSLGETGKQWFESVDWKQTGSDIIGLLKDGINILVNDIPQLIQDIGLAAIEWAKEVNWLQLGKDIIDFIGTGINLWFDNIPTYLQNIANTAIAWFKAVNWGGVGKTVIEFIKAGIQLFFVNIPNKLYEIATSAIEYFKSEQWASTGKVIITKIVNGIKEFVLNIPNKLSEIAASAIDMFKKNKWVNAGKKIIEKIVNGVTEVVNDIPNKLSEIAASAISFFKKGEWKKSGKNIISKIVDGLKEKFTSIPDKLVEIVTDAIAKITDIETWKKVGQDIINGIVEGIKSIPDAIGSAVKGAIGGAVNAAKSAFGIHSPSTYFRDELGIYLGEGIVVGFNRGVAGLTDDMLSQVRDAKAAVGREMELSANYTVNGRIKQIDDMPNLVAGAVIDGVQKIADGVERGISGMKMVANNRETARFMSDLGFARA